MERLSSLSKQATDLRTQLVMLERQRLQVQTHLLRLEGAIAILEELSTTALPVDDGAVVGMVEKK